MFSIFDLTAMLLTLTAAFGWFNRRFIHLPHTIGLLVMGLLASLLLILGETVLPGMSLYENLSQTLKQIDFTDVVFNGMLAFLLFAGAMNLNMQALRDRIGPVLILAVMGTLISTAIVGVATWLVADWIGYPLPLIWTLVFGALISPTDPIAVLSALRTVRVSDSLRIEMQGEALFNDGVGIVLFTVLLGFAANPNAPPGIGEVAMHLLREAGGGLAFGAVTGYAAYRAIRAIDDFPVEVLITLALVMGTYSWAGRLGLSGPLSVVMAGIIVGYRAPRDAMSDQTQTYVSGLWTLIDEVLNSILFLLIGLEVLVLGFNAKALPIAALAIPIVLFARLVAVSSPVLLFHWTGRLSAHNIPFLTWAGVRGGISVALALTLPASAPRSAIMTATYAVVLFTLIAQGTTLGLVARRTLRDEARGDNEEADTPG